MARPMMASAAAHCSRYIQVKNGCLRSDVEPDPCLGSGAASVHLGMGAFSENAALVGRLPVDMLLVRHGSLAC